MQPASIQSFERFCLASVVVWLILNASGLMKAAPYMAGNNGKLAFEAKLVVIMVIGYAAARVFLCYFTAQRASTVAKWTLFVLILVELLFTWLPFVILVLAFNASKYMSEVPLSDFVQLGTELLLQVICVVLLFRPDAREWFARKGKPADIAIFA